MTVVLVVALVIQTFGVMLLIYKLEAIHREERNELQNRIALEGKAVIPPAQDRQRTPDKEPEEDDFNRVGFIVTGEPVE